MNEIHWLGVLELARAIAARQLSPVEVVDAHLKRIDQLNPRLRCYLSVFADSAMAAARAKEGTVLTGQRLGPLHGVPVAVKDLFAMKGTPTTAGSRFLNEPSTKDCTVVARLHAAGAILLGKLNLHEFAYGPEGINSHHGTPWNPWDATTARVPGGSSSGSGVAVAAGLTPMGMGSDTGGSIRIPAACCGTVGLKPTYGRVSRAGVFPLSWSLDHAGPLTRTVEDAAAILSVIAGHDPADPSTSNLLVPDYVAGLSAPLKELRVGVIADYLEQAAPEVRAAIGEAITVLERLGCKTQEVKLPRARYSLAVGYAILATEALAHHRPLLREHVAEYTPDIRRRLAAAAFLSAADYLKGQRARQLLRQDVDNVLHRVDCLLAPTLPIPAPPVGANEVQLAGRPEPTRLVLTMFTRLFNLTGHPVLSLPCGFSKEGLPLSLQLVGRAFDEAAILRLGKEYQDATPWHTRRPAGV